MARIALVLAGVVDTVVIAPDGWTSPNHDESVTLPSGSRVGPGWVYSAGEFVAPTIAAPVPRSVTMRQARLALLNAGLLSSVGAAIDAMSEPSRSAARIEWEYSNELQRENALVLALAPALGLTSEQVDVLFISARAL